MSLTIRRSLQPPGTIQKQNVCARMAFRLYGLVANRDDLEPHEKIPEKEPLSQETRFGAIGDENMDHHHAGLLLRTGRNHVTCIK